MSTTRCYLEEPTLTADPPANVLLQAPSLSDGATSICPQLGAEDCDSRNLLLVSLSGTPERRLDAWRRHGGLPEKVAVITADATRSAAAEGGSVTRSPDGTVVSTTTVSEPSDLTGIGIEMSKCLSAWADDGHTHVCFDSLTALLQYADIETVFRYVRLTNKRIASAGGTAHYHIDPGAHDEETMATLRMAFDEVFEYDTDSGAWSAV